MNGELPIDLLVVDPKIQPRVAGLQESHVRALVEAISSGADLPPLTVTPHPDGRRYLIIDGAHRLEAFRRLGARTVRVQVQEGAGFWEAFRANLFHGLPLALEDRKHAAQWLKQHRPQLSVRQIAHMVGLAPSTVHDALSGNGTKRGAAALGSPNPWQRFLHTLTRYYTQHAHEENFVERFAEALVSLVERQKDPGTVWDALYAFSDAIRLGWDLTEHLYEEAGDENPGEQPRE